MDKSHSIELQEQSGNLAGDLSALVNFKIQVISRWNIVSALPFRVYFSLEMSALGFWMPQYPRRSEGMNLKTAILPPKKLTDNSCSPQFII